jgi:HD-GYP domain-containing protein (c-di-GMP phosphodiesterase class II)
MREKADTDILSLSWASKIMGAHLDLGNVCQEIIKRFKKDIPVKKLRLFIWDKTMRRFIPGVPSKERSSLPGFLTGREMAGIVLLNEPEILRSHVLVPLKHEGDLVGLLEFPDKKVFFGHKEKILRLSGLVAVALANIRLFMESELRTQDMFRFNVLSRALNPTVHEEEIVKILLEGIGGSIKFDIAGMLILNKESKKLFIKSYTPLSKSVLGAVKNSLMALTENLTRNTLNKHEISEIISFPKGEAASRKIKSHLDAPLITKGKFLGVLTLCSFEQENFSPRDSQNISSLVSHGAVAFENAMLYEDLRRTYFSIIKALTSAIEAKDEHTRGHSVLVSKYGTAIASEMGLSVSMVESIQIAGLLHDLGKIGVPEEILVKKGKLTESEYEIVKTHPDIALKILGPVEFPHFKNEKPVAETIPEMTLEFFESADLSSEVKLIIYHHHEQYGGGGYPQGIKGEEIPLGARILSVADTFEALTADRPYRKAFSLVEALKILREIGGKQLDPKIVEVMIRIVREKGLETLRSQEGI